MGSTLNNRLTTTEPTEEQPMLQEECLNAFYWRQIFTIDYIVVKTQNC